MTHTEQLRHHTVETTNAWLQTPQARSGLIRWLATDAPDTVVNSVRLNIIGWAPLDAIRTNHHTQLWLAGLKLNAPAAHMLAERFLHDWIGTRDEHEQFHMWAGTDAICGGCWS